MGKSLLITSILGVLLFTQCSKCHDKELPAMFFSQQDLNIVPFLDFDTIRFKSSSNDVFILFGTRGTQSIVFMENSPSSDAFALDHCRGQYYETQYNNTEFSDGLISRLSIRLRFSNIFHEYSNEKTISFLFNAPDTSTKGFNGKFQFNYDSIFASNYPLGNEIIEGYTDTLKLGPHTFYKIYKFYSDPDSYSQSNYSDWVQRLYYSVSEGLVGISLKSGKYYYLDKGK